MQQHLADKNIALDLVRVTEAAALASAKFTGLGDKELVDRAAVDAMRIAFQSLHIKGTIVIGEGEKMMLLCYTQAKKLVSVTA